MNEHTDTHHAGEEPLDPKIVYEAIYDAVHSRIEWPLWDQFLPIFYNAVADGTYTILPPRSHLRLFKDGKWIDGVTIVALGSRNDKGRAMTERGDWVVLDENTVLVVGS